MRPGHNYKDLLRESGYKATSPRLKIIEVLEKTTKPLSIQSIVRQVKNRNVDQVTVYRTLNTLVKLDIVRQIDFRHSHAHFELNRGDDHHHLVCTDCGAVEDFTGCDSENMIAAALKKSPSFAQVLQHSVELFGLCKTCIKK